MTHQEIDTGDTVKHRPTGETWTVACVQGEHLSWVGWPEGHCYLSDCELIQKATPEERQELLERMAEIDHSDHRARYARLRLAKDSPVESTIPPLLSDVDAAEDVWDTRDLPPDSVLSLDRRAGISPRVAAAVSRGLEGLEDEEALARIAEGLEATR